MREYSNEISLVRNGRGVYCIDTTMGCSSGMSENSKGCYGDCYAARTAKRYGHDFTKTVLRKFKSEKHKREVLYQISKIRMPFIRIGCSGDPSENWDHTLSVLGVLAKSNTEIVIITRHWKELTEKHLLYLSRVNVCINTSVSPLDNDKMLSSSIHQYNRIKPYCKSILRIISCDFNTTIPEGLRLSIIQDNLFKNESTIETVFRPSKNNPLVLSGIVNVKEEVFNGKKCLASKYNRKTYMGKCSTCKEMCGQSVSINNTYPNKRSLIKQGLLFKKAS